jgi:hypothetical protein
MTVTSTSSSTTLIGNGSNITWPYSFKIPDVPSLVVQITDTLGVVTTVASGAYSVSGLGLSAGGTVTYPLSGSPLPSGYRLTIKRAVPLTQLTQINNLDGLYAQSLETALDRAVMMIQQLQDQITTLGAAIGGTVSDAAFIARLTTVMLELPTTPPVTGQIYLDGGLLAIAQ